MYRGAEKEFQHGDFNVLSFVRVKGINHWLIVSQLPLTRFDLKNYTSDQRSSLLKWLAPWLCRVSLGAGEIKRSLLFYNYS